MKHTIVSWMLTLGISSGAALCATSANALEDGFKISGLAMHQETSRDIYLGAIQFNEMVPKPDDLVLAPGPKIMEYRVVARRTSVRSLLGGMLLQAELATGESPSANVMEFANAIMSNVKGSLYTGDSLEIFLTEDDATVARLNGTELSTVQDGTVADYFLMGWVGSNGPTTNFRTDILAQDVDMGLMAKYNDTEASDDRIAAVAAWFGDQSEMVAVTEAPVESASSLEPPKPNPGAMAATTAAASTATITAAEAAPEPEIDLAGSADILDVAGESAASEDNSEAEEPVQLASIGSPAPIAEEPDPLADLSVVEYSQRLAVFNNMLFRKVNSKVRYPKSAIRRNLQGELELDLTLSESGDLIEVAVVSSSGHRMLDEAAQKAAERAFDELELDGVDPVAAAEYSDGAERLIIPVPVKFVLSD